MLFLCFQSFAQIEKENQFTNEIRFNRVTGNNTAIEFDFGHNYTSEPNETNPFYKSSQISGRLWLHYYATKKWKLSGFISYLYNEDVPEITQKESPEIRFAAQGIYYFIKKDYVLTNRFRIEDRILQNEDSSFDVVYRFREMVKLVYPISVVKFGKGSLYGIASEEIIFKTDGSTTGGNFFDRNRLTVGLGYSFSDTFQFELTYINQYLPRDTNDKMYNTISTTLIFNDLISILRKKNGKIPTY
ncbi:DUF2490 domain-containing protein [Flavobacterium sp. WC2509]|uniref:DUF2490 domain-containing protein n=1 Tax=Flavobacterium sp. WC2509 TaxID=3461406 RepID=UPI004043F17D